MLRAALLLASLPVWQQVLAAGTSFLNHTELLSGVENPDWYEQNIPLIDLPSPQIQDVYYYRWQTYKEHLAYTGAQHGYLATEFLHPASYGAPFGGIVAAAGHHIAEGRWVRDLGYGRDLVNYWLAGPGQLPKPATEELNKDTHDWAHEYSFWAASAVWKRYLVTGDRNFTAGQLGNLVRQYRGWDSHFSPDLGLYWQVPVWDATEYTAASYESPGGDPYHGGAGFRPTINAYQYGDARAIAAIAALVGDAEEDLQAEYEQRAASLRQALQTHLWNEDKKFFMHRDRDFGRTLLQDREIMGFLPWMFAMPPGNFSTEPFAQLTDARGFLSTFGPTTLEQRSKWYMHEADACCRWDGPSWPFATSQTLTAVETLLHEYRQSTVTPSDYVTMLETYAKTLYKGGRPYVAEAHHPAEDRWIYDGRDHSEDYNHSTFVDNVLAGLLGIRGQAGDTLVVRPLVPPSWAYFAVENVAYHGRSVTVLWDESGTRYHQGKGFSVFVDGALSAHRDAVEELTIRVTPAVPQAPTLKVNIAANTQNDARLSRAFASYTSGFDDPMRAIDGNVWRTAVPSNSRWTSYDSPNATDYFGVDLRRTQSLCDVRLYFYDDGGGVRIPDRYDLQYYRNDDDDDDDGGGGGTWETVPGQQRSKAPTPGSSNEEIRVTFPALAASQLRVVAPNPGGSAAGQGWGLSELEVWTAALFHLRGEHSGKLMGVERMLGTPGARVQQYDDNGTRDHHWRFAPAAGGWSTVENLNSGLVLAIASRGEDGANNTNLVQDDYDYDDNGEGPAPRQLWKVQAQGSGRFLLRNKGSGLVAGIEANSTSNSANVVLREDDGAESNLWSVLPAAIEGC